MIIVLVTKLESFRLKYNFRKSIEDDCIRRVIHYISLNISQKISIEELTKLAGIRQTTFFKLLEFNK